MTLAEVQTKMQGALEHLKGELAQIRTGRANSALVADITVEAYDSKLTVKEISPWDKSIITNIVGGIAKANIGLNGVVDGDLIRIVIPPLTSERREQFIKQMHRILEKYRVEIRQIRHQQIEELRAKKQSGEIGEDEEKRHENELQKLHDEFIEAIEVSGKAKEEQLREV